MYDQNQGPTSIAVPKLFFRKSKQFSFPNFFQKFQIFLMFPHFLGDISFYKLEIQPGNNPKIYDIWQQIWFQGAFYDEKIPHTIGN